MKKKIHNYKKVLERLKEEKQIREEQLQLHLTFKDYAHVAQLQASIGLLSYLETTIGLMQWEK